MRKHLEAISPTTNVGSITSALFVAQGANDPRVPASEAEQIVKAVRAKGKDVWFMLARNEGHGFARKSNRDIYLLLSILFFENHLGQQPAE
jgi:dipeptidyl aminopeptidase/acylaminoacyl peptidase